MEKAAQDSKILTPVDFELVFNRNEQRVMDILIEIINREGIDFSVKDVQDAYALTMNNIPPHYVHRGTIVLHPNVTTDEIQSIARDTLTQVLHISKP